MGGWRPTVIGAATAFATVSLVFAYQTYIGSQAQHRRMASDGDPIILFHGGVARSTGLQPNGAANAVQGRPAGAILGTGSVTTPVADFLPRPDGLTSSTTQGRRALAGIPFVPCACSDPGTVANWDTKRRLDCAVLDDGTQDGASSLANQQMQMDGMVTFVDYLSQEDETEILNELNVQEWLDYSGKTCQEHGQSFSFYLREPTSDIMPPSLQRLAQRLVDDSLVSMLPNYVLVNRYTTGQGIHAHIDDTYYDDGIAGFTLGSGASLDFFRDVDNPYYKSSEGKNNSKKYADGTGVLQCGTGFLTPGSVFVMHREARYGYKHEMKRRSADTVVYATVNTTASGSGRIHITRVEEVKRSLRYAVTFRHVKQQVIDDRSAGIKKGSRSYASYK